MLLFMKDSLQNTSKGPLDKYRAKASFDWKSLKLHLEGEDCIEYQKKLWKFVETHPAFERTFCPLSLDESRRRTVAQINALRSDETFSDYNNIWINYLFYHTSETPLKLLVMYRMVNILLVSLGTEKHLKYLEDMKNNRFLACLALTEVGHGSNSSDIRTEARYDPSTQSFILNTSNFEAAKCWPSGLGQTATHAMLYAQLITPDGIKHGIHVFVVQIRDVDTMLPMMGVTLGDIGEKIGLNGVDNGFVMFDNYAVSRDSLLNEYADVTPEGKYVTAIKDDNVRFATTLGVLSSGRVNVVIMSAINAGLAVTIAIRYSASRKQFGPSSKEEWPVLEYQAQQGRLLPHLAAVYAMKIFAENFVKKNEMLKDNIDASASREIHGLSCAMKAHCAWVARDAIQDCREACGGHGYLKISRLGTIRQDHDANCTGEGDGNVIIQQTSNWLLNEYSRLLKGKRIVSPFDSASFLNDIEKILSLRFDLSSVDEVFTIGNLLVCLKWLTCFYLKKTYELVKTLRECGNSNFVTRNDSQLFNARTLSLVYAEHALVQEFARNNDNPVYSIEEKRVLNKLCCLYATSCIEKRLGDFYAGGFANSKSKMDVLIRQGIIDLCKELSNDAVSLVDVIAPPDHVINSPLGMSDGNVYKHLEEFIRKDPGCFGRPEWWREILRSNL